MACQPRKGTKLSTLCCVSTRGASTAQHDTDCSQPSDCMWTHAQTLAAARQKDRHSRGQRLPPPPTPTPGATVCWLLCQRTGATTAQSSHRMAAHSSLGSSSTTGRSSPCTFAAIARRCSTDTRPADGGGLLSALLVMCSAPGNRGKNRVGNAGKQRQREGKISSTVRWLGTRVGEEHRRATRRPPLTSLAAPCYAQFETNSVVLAGLSSSQHSPVPAGMSAATQGCCLSPSIVMRLLGSGCSSRRSRLQAAGDARPAFFSCSGSL